MQGKLRRTVPASSRPRPGLVPASSRPRPDLSHTHQEVRPDLGVQCSIECDSLGLSSYLIWRSAIRDKGEKVLSSA